MDKRRRGLINNQIKLIYALKKGRSEKWCLNLWSRFIKARDQYQCLICSSKERIQAHHIFRRSLYPFGWFQPGNGITLCLQCHDRQHAKFNRSPDLNMPVDAQGGDDLNDAFYYLDCLAKDASIQNLNHDEFYYIEEHMLRFFMRLQGCEHMTKFLHNENYTKLEIALEIWRTSPPNMIQALIRANIPKWAL